MSIITKANSENLPLSRRAGIALGGITASLLALSLVGYLFAKAVDEYLEGQIFLSAGITLGLLALSSLAIWCLLYAAKSLMGREYTARKLSAAGLSAKRVRIRCNVLCYLTVYACLATYLSLAR